MMRRASPCVKSRRHISIFVSFANAANPRGIRLQATKRSQPEPRASGSPSLSRMFHGQGESVSLARASANVPANQPGKSCRLANARVAGRIDEPVGVSYKPRQSRTRNRIVSEN
jgi:hypothetical protein